MEKLLKLYVYVDGDVGGVPFPNAEDQIEIGAFRYDAKRMGGAPSITASVNYPSCLDDEWTDNVYAEFNGERYFLKQTPTSSYDNADAMYKHDIELVSERVALDNVYFFDVVTGDPMDSDKPVSNSTKVVFFGGVRDFASRLQASLDHSGLDYEVIVDSDVTSEEKLMSFEDQFFSNVLQEVYNTYNVPYYFDGKRIHIGFAKNQELPTFAYGVDDALISITKNNANYKIVNRATGTGSSDNIPFYYPNNSPKGVIKVASDSTAIFKLIDGNAFANEVGIGDVVTYKSSTVSSSVSVGISNDGNIFSDYNGGSVSIVNTNTQPVNKWFLYTFNVSKGGSVYVGGSITIDGTDTRDITEFLTFAQINMGKQVEIKDGYIDCGVLPSGICNLKLGFSFPYLNKASYNISLSLNNSTGSEWYNETQKKTTSLSKMGLVIVSGQPRVGDTLTQELVEYINTSQVLLPYKYRETKGAERFYNATNNTYEGITFNNPFVAGRPKEHIIKVEDIKPSIEGMIVNGERIDMFEDFAYDEDDNDETYEDEEGNVYYKHPYFFAKLKPLGFNLFEHAIEQQPMTISFTSGDCGACNFEIAVDEESQKNTVQVDENGNVMRDENGRVLCGAEGSGQGLVEPQDIQQDTTNRSVWIALQKEDSTYGILMPKAPINGVGGHRPSTNDTFAVLGINLPYEYIENAEKKLEAEIIKYLQNNNDEKFTFSISFSRIYFEENPDVLALLSENSKIQITYNNKDYDLYVSSFSYSMGEGDVLPEIRIELDETLKTSQNALQNAISEVKSTLGNAINQVSYKISTQSRSYVSKVEDDTALGTVDFSKGIKFGEGGKVDILDNNSAKLTIEYLEVTKKASFTSLEIQEKTHVGGQILVTPAAINCGEVEEFDDYYRCYFQTKGEDGEEIFNQFAVGDQAICQTFNAWGSRYYWRLVVGIGNDYIDLSKTDYDDGSGIPQAGDKIIQMGNRSDASRQNAIVIAAYGNGSPYIIQYKGINNYLLPTTSEDERIMTKLSPTENILTGLVRMKAGSSGLEKFTEWQSKQELIDSKASKGDFEDFKAIVEDDLDLIKRQVDGAITTWFYDPVPTLENAPAVEWTTEDDKINHLGDLYYSGEGKAYRFQYDNGTSTYYWNVITDTDIIKALADAKRAQDTADGKRRVFVTQPYPPYDEGDLWSRGSEFPMMVCVNSRESGSYVASDWDFADNNNQLSNEIAGYEYLKEAIQNGDTVVLGGLIQSGVLMLGYNDAYGNYHVMSGTNGIYRANEVGGGIAAWWGGDMSESLAKAVIRFDGTGFLANGNIRWDEEGGAEFGGGDFKILADGSIIFGEDIKISTEGDETLGSILTELNNRVTKAEFNTWKTDVFNPLSTKVNDHTDKINKILSWFELREDEDLLITTHNLASYKEISSNGISQGTGGGGSGLISSVLGVSSLGATLANDNSVVFNAYATNEIYKVTQGHASRIGVLESQVGQLTTQSTKVSVSDLLATGTKIATITVDGVAHEVKGDFLPTSGGTISGNLTIKKESGESFLLLGTNGRVAYNPTDDTTTLYNGGSGYPALKVQAGLGHPIFRYDYKDYTVLHSGNANKTDVPWAASNILFPTGTSATWNIHSTNGYKGITVLNAVQAKPDGAPDHYAVGLSVSGYYGFTLASLGGGDVLLYRRGQTDWKTIAFTSDLENYLPLSGGTLQGDSADLLVINRLSSTSTAYITFRGNNSLRGRIGFDANNNPIVQDVNYGSRILALIHSGNVGSQIVEGITTHTGDATNANGDIAKLNSYYSSKGFRISRFNGLNGLGTKNSDGLIINWPLDYAYGQQWYMDDESHTIQTRYVANNAWSAWKTIAFTDSNVASATKLATASGILEDFTVYKAPTVYGIKLVNGDSSSRFGFYSYETGKYASIVNTKNDIENCGLQLNDNGNVYVFGKNVGIGTNAPQYKLDINGSTRITNNVIIGDSSTPNGRLRIVGENILASTPALYISNSAGDGLLDVRNNGNVGIGTANPAYKLDVNGDANIEGVLSTYFKFAFRRESENVISVPSIGSLSFMVGDNKSIILNSFGNVTIGDCDVAGTDAKLWIKGKTVFSISSDQWTAVDLSSVKFHLAESNPYGYNTGSFLVRGDTSLAGFGFRGDKNRLYYAYIGNNADNPWLAIKTNGNVLIGTMADDGEKLQVNGDIRIKPQYGSLVFEHAAYFKSYGNKRFLIHNENGLFLGLETTEQDTLIYGKNINLNAATSISKTLSVGGNTTINGIAYFGGTTYYINTSGNANFNAISGSSLQVDSAVFNGTIHSNEYNGSVAKWSITKDGAASFDSLSNGGLLETSTLRVSSTSTFTGKTNHNGGIGAAWVSISGTLEVGTTSTFTGKTTHNGGIKATDIETRDFLATGDAKIYGELRLQKESNANGNYLYFGDGSFCYLHEENDDRLTIYAQKGLVTKAATGTAWDSITKENWIDDNSAHTRFVNNYNALAIIIDKDYGASYRRAAIQVGDTSNNVGTLYLNPKGGEVHIASSGVDTYVKSSLHVGSILYASTIYAGSTLYLQANTITNQAEWWTLSATGDFYTLGNIAAEGEISANALNQGSDIRFKHQLGDITLDLDTIANAPMFRFTWTNKENSRVQIGTSAQYWKDSARELVSVDKDDFHRLDYATLGVLIGVTLGKTVKNHEDRIKELEREVVELKEENRRLRYEC